MKKRNRSIITDDLKQCFICGNTEGIEIHEIFFGTANRKKSIEHGLYVGLCGIRHHRGQNGVHHNRRLDLKLKKIGQAKFEETHSREEFIKEFGRSYLWEG